MPSQPRASATPPLPATTPASSAQMSTSRPPSRLAVAVALAIVYVIWGSTYLGIRIVAASLPAFGSAAMRFGLAAILLIAALAVLRGWRQLRVTWRQLGACAVVGVLLLAGGNGLVVLAESPQFALPSGVAALVISLNPLIMVVLRTVTGDRPALGTVAGVVIGLAGLVALFLPGLGGDADHPVPLAGGLLALGAVTCWCVGSFATRWLPMPADPFVASGYEMVAGAAAMALIAVARSEPVPWLVPDVPMQRLAGAGLPGRGGIIGRVHGVHLAAAPRADLARLDVRVREPGDRNRARRRVRRRGADRAGRARRRHGRHRRRPGRLDRTPPRRPPHRRSDRSGFRGNSEI